MNERKDQFNSQLTEVVCQRLTGRDESLSHLYEAGFSVSAATGLGVLSLVGALERHAAELMAGSELALITRARHRRALESALAALRRAASRPVAEREDLLAEELRLAARDLARLSGRVDVEDVLDVILRDFCIGK